jgi:hypothetical protein
VKNEWPAGTSNGLKVTQMYGTNTATIAESDTLRNFDLPLEEPCEPKHPSFNTAWTFLKANRRKLIRPGQKHIINFTQDLGREYRTADFDRRIVILASLFREVGRYDAIARVAYYRTFENAAGEGHICACWDTCDEENDFCDFERFNEERQQRRYY